MNFEKKWVQGLVILVGAAVVVAAALLIQDLKNKRAWAKDRQIQAQRTAEENTRNLDRLQKEFDELGGSPIVDPGTHRLLLPPTRWVPNLLKRPKLWGFSVDRLKGAIVPDQMDRSLSSHLISYLELMKQFPDGTAPALSVEIQGITGIKDQKQPQAPSLPEGSLQTKPVTIKTIACDYKGDAFSLELPGELGDDGEDCDQSPQHFYIEAQGKRLDVPIACVRDLQWHAPEAKDPPSVCSETLAVPLDSENIMIFLKDAQDDDMPFGFVYNVKMSTTTQARNLGMALTHLEFHSEGFSIGTRDGAAAPRLEVWKNVRYANGVLKAAIDRERTWRSFPIKGIFKFQDSFDDAFGYNPKTTPFVKDDALGDYESYNYDFTYSEDGRPCVRPDSSTKKFCLNL